jgi:hypothetical protein
MTHPPKSGGEAIKPNRVAGRQTVWTIRQKVGKHVCSGPKHGAKPYEDEMLLHASIGDMLEAGTHLASGLEADPAHVPESKFWQ